VFEFLTVLLTTPVIVAYLLTIPLGGAYLEGIRSARDPAHRLTPRSAWFFFDRVVEGRLRGWRRAWIGAYLLALLVPALIVFIEPAFWADGLTWANIGICVMYANIGLSAALLIYASLLLLAPRFDSRRWLMAACLAPALFVLSPILFAASIVFYRAFSNAHAHALEVFTFGFVFFPVQILVLALALRYWVRARGDHWFRIEASRTEPLARAARFPAKRSLGHLPLPR